MSAAQNEKEVQVGDCILIFLRLTVGGLEHVMPTSKSITDPIYSIFPYYKIKLVELFSIGEEPTDGNNGTSAVATVRSHHA
jgi:hypothetical protein